MQPTAYKGQKNWPKVTGIGMQGFTLQSITQLLIVFFLFYKHSVDWKTILSDAGVARLRYVKD